jgi:DNA-binding HxlR family transcriptional regulator
MEERPLRHQSPVRLEACNLATSFGLIGDRWTLLILRSALYGVRRFDDFRAELAIPRTVLSNRLKRLVADGLMRQTDYRIPGRRSRPEYVLTEMGQQLRLPFLAMTQWADAWLGSDRPRPLMLKQRETGADLHIGLISNDGREVAGDELEAEFAPWARQ